MISIGTLLGILFLVPITLGNILKYILQEETHWTMKWVRGFIAELAIFFMSFLLLSKCTSYNFRVHSFIFVAIMLIICIIQCVVFIIKGKHLNKSSFRYKRKYEWKDLIFTIGIFLLMCTVMYSGVTTGIPEDSQDNTLEIINTVWKSNTVGRMNPYTGEIYLPGQVAYSEPAIAVFWTSVSWLSRLHPAILTGIALPVFFIGLFYACCYNIGLWFWNTDTRKSKIFILSILFLNILGSQRNWLLFYYLRSEPWMGDHILSFLLIPMLLFEIVKMGGNRVQNKKSYLFFVILLLVTFVMSENSWFYIAVIFVLTAIMYIGRKLWGC